MTKEEMINQIIELKENCKKLAEEYRNRYNQDNEDRIALNMFYHNVISYNDYESVLALIENRNSVIMCFSAPPCLTEETVEINLKRIADLEKENAELKEKLAEAERTRDNLRQIGFPTFQSCKEYADKMNYAKEIIRMLVDSYNHKERFSFEKDLIKAEQFVNSEVEK